MPEQKFLKILRRYLKYLGPSEALAPADSLPELGLDSMDTVALLMDLESEYKVTLGESSLTPQTFSTPANLWNEFQRALAPGTAQSVPSSG